MFALLLRGLEPSEVKAQEARWNKPDLEHGGRLEPPGTDGTMKMGSGEIVH